MVVAAQGVLSVAPPSRLVIRTPTVMYSLKAKVILGIFLLNNVPKSAHTISVAQMTGGGGVRMDSHTVVISVLIWIRKSNLMKILFRKEKNNICSLLFGGEFF